MSSFNLADLFESVVDTVPERLALVAGNQRLKFAELDARCNRLANHLQAQGVGSGDKVAIYAYNRAEWVEAMWACFKIRAIPININFRYVEEELLYIFDNADVSAVIFERGFSPLLSNLRGKLPKLQHQLVLEDGSDEKTDALPYEDALAAASDARQFKPRRSDDIYMLYTGGTTGMPKGTLWRHEDIFFGALQGGNPGGPPITAPEQLCDIIKANPNPYASLCPAPMMHGGGMWFCMIYQLAGNCFVLYTERNFDADKLLELAAREKALNMIIVGDAMARPLADAIATGKHDTSSLFVIGSGGAILSRSVKDQLRKLLPNAMIMDSFGASETGSAGMVMDLDKSESAGPRFTLSETTKILDEDSLEPIAPGSDRIGLLAKSGAIPFGYYKDDKKTAETFREDAHGVRWVIPGDYAKVLEDGTIELLGRGSMCINSGGEKIFPEEVEAALKGHPAIFDAGVIGVPDERFGSRVIAVVQARDKQQIDPEEVKSYCRSRIAGYKCPREVLTVDEIPRTPAAKPDYRRLKALVERLLQA